MTCSVSYNEHTGGIAVRDEVRAPNGEKSILYEHIKAAIPTNYQPDAYVLTAFKTGTINSLSIDDVAFALWSKLHTDWLEKDMKASGMPRDRNGEPLFAYVHERIGLPNVHKRYLLSGAKGASVVVKKLEANGWIERVGGKFRVLGSEFGVQRSELTVGEEGLEGMDMERWRMEMDEAEGSEEEAKTEAKDKERGAVEEHRFKINYLLDWLGIPEGFVQYEEQEGHTYVRFNPDLFQVNDRLNDTDASAYSNTRSLLGYLADRSPQLQFRFVSEEEGRTLYDALERPGKLPFEKANSFVDKGVVYLIRGRVNNLVAIEEVLHPFVHTIAETNKDLFAHLLDAARKDYEGLDEEIKSRYTDEAGFTNDERDRELVTQVLTQVYADEVEQYKAKSVRAVLPKLIDWLLQLVKELGDLLGGKDRFLIRPQDLSSRMNLTDVAELLNTYDSTFLIDARTMGASFSLATEKETFQRKLLKGANPLQEKMIKDLMEPQEPAVYDADQKAYVGTNGEEYQSLKTAIDGEETDADGRDGLRQVFGIHAAHVLEGLALGESFDAVKDVVEGVDVAVAEKAYHALAEQLESLVPDDSVVVPNVVVSDYDNDVASTLDLVVLDADGKLRVVSLKLSADSIFDKARYEQDRKPVGTLSQLTGESLSALQRHGIRVAGERRLLENNGYEVEQGVSVHVHVPDMGVGTGKKAYDVKVEDVQEHEAFDHRVLLNQVFPIAVDHKRSKQERFKKILGKGNPTRNRRFLRKEEQGPEEPLKEPVDAATVKQEVPKELKDLSAEIDKLMKAVQYHPKSPMVQKLSELVKFVQFDLTKGQGTLAYARFLNKAQEEIDKIMAFLADETKVGDSEYARVAIEAEMYLRSFEGIADAFHLKLGREFHSKKLTTLLRSLNALNSRIYMSLEQFILHLVRTTSTKELTKDDLEDLVAHAIDISKEKYLFNDIDSSPDTLTAVAARTYKRTRQTAMDRIEAFQKRVDKKIEETEKIAGPIDIKKFIELDDKGQPTGRYVQKIGPVYFRLLEALENKVRTVEGMLRQYRKVTSLASAKQEDLDYNKKLFADNQAIRKFKEAETQTATGVTDGMYHQYKQDYKTEREKFEEYQPQFKNGVFTGGKWVRKKTYNNVPISDYAYNQFRDKYYDIIIYDKPIFQNKVFTGAFVKNGGKMRVVKQEYINIREVAGDGTDMVSKQWNALNDDMSAKGRAVWGMYTFFVDEMEKTLALLPPNVQRSLMGDLARIRANFIEKSKDNVALLKAVAKGAGGWFTTRSYAKSAIYNEDGTIANQIPIFFTGNLRNEEAIAQLKAELAQLDKDHADKKIGREQYLKLREEKETQIKEGERAPSADELSTNLLESLVAFRAMAENYKQLNDIEGVMQAVLKILGKRKYNRNVSEDQMKMMKATGLPYELQDGTQSWTYKRFKKFMEMVFYNSEDLDDKTFDVVVKKLMSVSSVVNVGFNSFGAIHNGVMAQINTAIEAAGELFFTRKAYKRAVWLYYNEFLPGYLSSMNKKDGYHFKTKRPGSKYEAAVMLFRIFRQQQSGEHRIHLTTPAFLLMEAGEYAAQTQSGISYLLSHDLKNNYTNETVSIYDALAFDKETGVMTLDPKYAMDGNMRYDITNSIYEMNKQIHGSYAWEDRMVIQQEAVGQAAAQYHKWVYPMYKARFGSRYYDENLKMWIEGRYRTVWHFFKYMYQTEGDILRKLKSAWHKLDPMQIKNMYRNAAELGFFMAAFAAYGLFRGLAGDDDDKNAKRWYNFLGWEADRVYKEILFWIPGAGIHEQTRLIKNPFAVGPTIDQFVGLLGEGLHLALPPYDDDVYYKAGPFKGQLKFTKELGDVLPLWKDYNKWHSFSQVTNFQVQY